VEFKGGEEAFGEEGVKFRIPDDFGVGDRWSGGYELIEERGSRFLVSGSQMGGDEIE